MTQSSAHLPIIDLSTKSKDTSKAVLQAAREDGFLYLRIPGLPLTPDMIKDLFNLSSQFFSLSPDEKHKYKILPNDRGYSAPFVEKLDENLGDEPGDYKEAFNLGESTRGEAGQDLPPVFAEQQAFLDGIQRRSREVCLLVLDSIAEGLEIDEDAGGRSFFSSRHEAANGNSASILRLIKYPAVMTGNANSSELRCGAHTDFGSMTLLFQRPGQPGLEVERVDPVTGTSTWLPVDVFPPGTENDGVPPLVVNIGDMLQSWTRGILKSTRHRVVVPTNREGDRYSIAYFCHPAADTKLVGVPSKIVREQGGEEREVITAAEHLKRKLDKAYGRE